LHFSLSGGNLLHIRCERVLELRRGISFYAVKPFNILQLMLGRHFPRFDWRYGVPCMSIGVILFHKRSLVSLDLSHRSILSCVRDCMLFVFVGDVFVSSWGVELYDL